MKSLLPLAAAAALFLTFAAPAVACDDQIYGAEGRDALGHGGTADDRLDQPEGK